MFALPFQRRSSRCALLCHIIRRSALSNLTIHGGSGNRNSREHSISSPFSFSNSISASYTTSSSRHISENGSRILLPMLTPVIANNTKDLAENLISRLDDEEIENVLGSFMNGRNRPLTQSKAIPSRYNQNSKKRKADVSFLNEWFARIFTNPEIPFYPVTIPPEKGLSEAIEELFKALRSANKNSDFLTSLVEGTTSAESRSDIDGDSMSSMADLGGLKEDGRDDEIYTFIAKNFDKTPVIMIDKVTSLVNEYVTESKIEIQFKKEMKAMSSIHQGFALGITDYVGMNFNNNLAVERAKAALKAKDFLLDDLSADLDFIQDRMLHRLERKRVRGKGKSRNKNEEVSTREEMQDRDHDRHEAFYSAAVELGLPGGERNSSSAEILEDLNAETQVSILAYVF
jgi:hypothetical protein